MANARAGAPRPTRVEVRHTRKGRALRINGTFASWYQPGAAATGSVWDALVAPMLLLPSSRRTRVLILGLGGGSAARLVRALAPSARTTSLLRVGQTSLSPSSTALARYSGQSAWAGVGQTTVLALR